MNLKKALVGCILALSLVVGVLFVANGKGSFFAEGDNYPPINAKAHSSIKVACCESYPPINGSHLKGTSSDKIASSDNDGPINTSRKNKHSFFLVAEGDNYPPINAKTPGQPSGKVPSSDNFPSMNA